MSSVRQLRPACLAICLALLCLPSARCIPTERPSDAQVEAAYLYNFAKFVEWPANRFSDANAPLRFCVLNDFSFEADLNRVVKGRSIAGHPLEVVPVRDVTEAVHCHILFINSSQERQMRRVVEVLRGSSVLTVGERDSFLEHGGMISFYVRDDQVQFQINLKAAREAGLYLSSRLLTLAKGVLD